MKKSKFLPSKLSQYMQSMIRKNVNSYHDFGSLLLKGDHNYLTFEEY